MKTFELKESKIDGIIPLLIDYREKPFEIRITFVRNNLVVRKICTSLRDFCYTWLDLDYNKCVIIHVTLKILPEENGNDITK